MTFKPTGKMECAIFSFLRSSMLHPAKIGYPYCGVYCLSSYLHKRKMREREHTRASEPGEGKGRKTMEAGRKKIVERRHKETEE